MEFLNNIGKSFYNNKDGVGLGAVIATLAASIAGFFMGGPMGAMIGGLVAALFAPTVTNFLSGGSKGDVVNNPNEAPIKSTSQADEVSNVLNEAQRRAHSTNPASRTAAAQAEEQVNTMLRSAGEQARQIERYNDENQRRALGLPTLNASAFNAPASAFMNKYEAVVVRNLNATGRDAAEVQTINIADAVRGVENQLTTEIAERRRAVDVDAVKKSAGGSAINYVAFSTVLLPTLIATGGRTPGGIAKDRVVNAMTAYDSGDIKTFREIASDMRRGIVTSASDYALLSKPTYDAVTNVIKLDDAFNTREQFFNDRTSLLREATAAVQNTQGAEQAQKVLAVLDDKSVPDANKRTEIARATGMIPTSGAGASLDSSFSGTVTSAPSTPVASVTNNRTATGGGVQIGGATMPKPSGPGIQPAEPQ
jgi:hypothetical protein